ncbi:hypothetical protein [Paraburkholderia silvatlantica]|uniref:Uncharacterized protein n=1 Tax=Paraburkholderia silvatlantica TaxID=321895 RepID=A0ABR6FHT6_9BURK|nr:hypothetical protein [Paraburkholderia silvatlantica]MBB2926992.1 hypothetical protein [Paraburkholderia silvatlantica]PVY36713.1 hypothetical protein C7411_1021 [Paraburkholderia silvatlantica]PXW42009.1 hypothetical protein C7413_102420 [Paraburkholderia silvatlantica]
MKNREMLSNSTHISNQPTSRQENFRDLFKRSIISIASLGVLLIFIPGSWRFVYFATSLILLIAVVSARTLQILYPKKFVFIKIRDAALVRYESLSRHQQLYTNVVLCTPFLIYAYLLDFKTLFIPLVILFFAYCLGVVAYDVYRIYATLSATTIGKGLIAIAFAAGSNLAFGISGKIIGGLTHVPPSTFPHTLSFIAIFAIPFLFMAAGTIYIPIAVLAAPVVIYGSKFMEKAPRLMKWFLGVKFDKNKYRHTIATVIFQIVFYSAIGTLTPQIFFLVLNRYDQQIESTIRSSIYEFDMYPGTECKASSDYHEASLGDENYILAEKQSIGVKFELPRKCAL